MTTTQPRTVQAPDAAAEADADRYICRAETLAEGSASDHRAEYAAASAAAAQAFALLAVAAELRALRAVGHELFDLLDTTLTDDTGEGLGDAVARVAEVLERRDRPERTR